MLRWSLSDAIGSSDGHFRFEALTTNRHGVVEEEGGVREKGNSGRLPALSFLQSQIARPLALKIE